MSLSPLPTAQVEELRKILLANAAEFRETWLAVDEKKVVPFEPILKLQGLPAKRMCRALRMSGTSTGYGFSSESWEGTLPHEGVLVPLEPSSVAEWHSMFLPFDMVISAADHSSAILFDQDEFGLAAGSEDFLEEFFGQPTPDAFRNFERYAEDMKEAARHLPAIARKYRDQYPDKI